MSWPKVEFEDLFLIPSRNGLTRPSRVRGSGFKMINMGELFAHDRIGSIEMELVPMSEKDLQASLVETNDLLFARQSLVLAGAGKCSIVKQVAEPTTFESHIIRVRLDSSRVHPEFYYYYFKSSASGMRSIVSQGVQAGIRGSDLKKLSIHEPPRGHQERIAGVLSAYDDLIENNRRRISLLEQAARLLYREWFVHFRFPGSETAKFIDGLPEGWEMTTYGQVFDFLGGFAFKSSTYTPDGRYGVVTIKNVQDGHFVRECPSRVDDIPAKVKEHCRLKTGDVLLSLTGNVGRSCLVVGDDYLLNQRVAKVIGKDVVPNAFCYWTFSNEDTIKTLENLAYGVAQLNLSPVKLSERPFVRPAPTILEEYNKHASAMMEQIINIEKVTEELRKARDLLLPRLMDGRLPIPE